MSINALKFFIKKIEKRKSYFCRRTQDSFGLSIIKKKKVRLVSFIQLGTNSSFIGGLLFFFFLHSCFVFGSNKKCEIRYSIFFFLF